MNAGARNWIIALSVIGVLLLVFAAGAFVRLAGTQQQLNQSQGQLKKTEGQLDRTKGRFKKTQDTLSQQHTFLAYEDKLLGALKTADNQWEEVTNGSYTSIEEVTAAANQAKSSYNSAGGDISSVSIPSELPDSVATLCRQSKDKMKSAADSMAGATDSWLAWIIAFNQNQDNPQAAQSAWDQYQTEMNDARDSVSEAERLLKQARGQLGLPSAGGTTGASANPPALETERNPLTR